MRSEFELIKHIKKSSEFQHSGQASAIVGIGDDCAVVPKDETHDLVITTDLIVEDVDFRLRWVRPHLLGHKALAVSLSDVASMGGKPVWSMLSIGIPEVVWDSHFIDEFYSGYLSLARRHGVQLIGGDVSKTPDKIVIDSIVAGEVRKGEAVLRSGARPGDSVFVSGSLGAAAAGLRLLEHHRDAEGLFGNPLVLRQFRPEPRVELGRLLGEKRLASAMIDLSDGLAGDLRHLCDSSGVGAVLQLDSLPIDHALAEALSSPDFPVDPGTGDDLPADVRLSLTGGEDFELLFTVRPDKVAKVEKLLPKLSITKIGEISANPGVIELESGGRTSPLRLDSFRHF